MMKNDLLPDSLSLEILLKYRHIPMHSALWDYNHDNSKDQQVLLSQLDLFYDSAKTKCNQLGIPRGIVSDQFLQSFIKNSHSELAPVSEFGWSFSPRYPQRASSKRTAYTEFLYI